VLNGDAPTPDYRLAVWMLAMVGAYAESVAVMTRRLERGLSVDPRPLWSPGTGLQDQPEFHALPDELGLVEFWEESGYADTRHLDGRSLVCDQSVLIPDNLQPLLAADVAANR
jgi:hypothetical protein